LGFGLSLLVRFSTCPGLIFTARLLDGSLVSLLP